MKITAKIISTLFHPLWMPTVGLLIIFNTPTYLNYTISFELKRFITILMTLTTIVIPILFTLILLNKKSISSINMEQKKERNIPYLISIFLYFFTLYFLYKFPIPNLIYKFVIGAAISVTCAFIINLKWKISAHMIGIGGVIGALFCIAFLLNVNITVYLTLTLILAGLIGTSRLILNAHTPAQVYTGFLLGIICQVIVFL